MSTTVDQLANVAKLLLQANEEVVFTTETLKQVKEHARVLREETVPGMMQELGITSLTLSSGQKLTITQEVYASIPVERKTHAFQWLNANGHGGLIKTTVSTFYTKGQREIALALVNELEGRGLNAVFEEKVHPQTLKAFIKEQLRDAVPIPLDIFGARPVMTARIK